MALTVRISGSDTMDTSQRKDAMDAINELPTKVLLRLKKVSRSPKAVEYFENDGKYRTVRMFLNI
ncbi:hypothetical protein ACFQ1M_09770 [Sungkyunkwania multivorans]|uniref:Uncharacterized protein n=1 Tax=Sungkyunkwania multivorans TaxID=1173618 RepID=A0ABW3CYU1_9FLAO